MQPPCQAYSDPQNLSTVVSAFKLQARRYPSDIFVGMIMYPAPAVEVISRAVSDFVTRTADPKVGMNVFVLSSQSKFFATPVDSIGLMVYDANGLEHGRSEEGFKWALDIPGAVDMTDSMTLAQFNNLQGSLLSHSSLFPLSLLPSLFPPQLTPPPPAHTHTTISTLTITHACALIRTIDPHLLTRAWAWFSHLKTTSPALAAGSFLILELLQPAALTSAAPDATAWPHPTTQHHILQFGVGYPTGFDCSEALAAQVMRQGLREVPLRPVRGGEYLPNFVEAWMSVKKVCRAGWRYARPAWRPHEFLRRH